MEGGGLEVPGDWSGLVNTYATDDEEIKDQSKLLQDSKYE
jgi:hypothetical protein